MRDVFAYNIKRLRKERNLTQSQLADLLTEQNSNKSTSQRYVSDYEKGKRWPTESFVLKISKALSCDPQELFLPIGYHSDKQESESLISELSKENRRLKRNR